MAQIRSMPLSVYLLFSLISASTVPEITINLYDYAGIGTEDMARVERSAGGSLHEAGILIRWRICQIPGSKTAGDPTCAEDGTDATHLRVAILPERMARKIATSPKQYGIAATSGAGSSATHAYVFYDRVMDLAQNQMAPWSLLLGATVAHEVGHLLLGDNSHFSVGIMCARWGTQEVKQALMGALTFTPRQAEAIRGDVRRRAKVRADAE